MGSGDPLADRRLALLQGGTEGADSAYPATHAGWEARYQYLIDAYHGENYSQSMIKRLNLFRALDDDGKIIGLTRRLHRDIQFVVDTGRGALSLSGVTLQRREGATDAEYAAAEAIWARSSILTMGSVWSLTLACMGDLFIEAARVTPGSQDVSLIGYRPDAVYTEYDLATASRLIRAVISTDVIGEAEVDVYGNVAEAGALYTYQRTLTPTDIAVASELPPTAEGVAQRQIDASATGPHGLGVVPMVHVRCIPTVHAEHSLPVTHGIDRGLAEVDSMASQISAVADRFANPKPYLFGAKIGDQGAISRFGRWINAWGNNSDKISAGYLEPSMDGISRLHEALERLIRDIRVTFPEFLFVGGGSTANLSGEALRLLQSRYVAKYEDIRGRYYAGLERALAMGVALQLRQRYDPSRHPVSIEGAPLLPGDKKMELETLTLARGLGAINQVDLIRHTQRLGIASEELTAEDYLEEMLSPEERTGLDTDHMALMEMHVSDLEDAEEELEALQASAPEELSERLVRIHEAISDAIEGLRSDMPDREEAEDV